MLIKSIKRKIEAECFCQIKYIIMLIILIIFINRKKNSNQYNLPPLHISEWIVQTQDENNIFIMSNLTVTIVSEQTVTIIK